MTDSLSGWNDIWFLSALEGEKKEREANYNFIDTSHSHTCSHESLNFTIYCRLVLSTSASVYYTRHEFVGFVFARLCSLTLYLVSLECEIDFFGSIKKGEREFLSIQNVRNANFDFHCFFFRSPPLPSYSWRTRFFHKKRKKIQSLCTNFRHKT